MSDTRLITVARYDSQGDARLAKARLAEADIPCMLANEEQAGLSMLFDSSRSGVQLKVPAEHAEAARAVLPHE